MVLRHGSWRTAVRHATAIAMAMAAACGTSVAAHATGAAAALVGVSYTRPGGQDVSAPPAGAVYDVRPAAGDNLSISPPSLPDLSAYTSQAVEAMVARTPAGHAKVEEMMEEVAFKAFMGRNEGLREWAFRQLSTPKAIFITGGYMTPADLAREVPKQYFQQTSLGYYVARLPILIRPDATLDIDRNTREFRLSLQRGAFLVNQGSLFITNSRFTAWNEAENAPARLVDEHTFRPFLLSWGGSRTYFDHSVVTSLGYARSKAYGVSISQYSPALAQKMRQPPPKGWILNSEFVDNWYGFYCYEAEDFVLLDNIYRDNIKYAIDPHDRSKRLIIAGNTTFGTKEKHGIIISRGVSDSWIFDNTSYKNGLSGIVIDRQSQNNVVAHNKVYQNGGNGITVYESSNNLIWQNVSSSNFQHGIYVRNSTGVRIYDNVVVGNALVGIYGFVKDVSAGRNLKIDPFTQKLSMTVVGGTLVSNGSGELSIDRPSRVELFDVDMRAPRRASGFRLAGILGSYQNQIFDILFRRHQSVIIEPRRDAGATTG